MVNEDVKHALLNYHKFKEWIQQCHDEIEVIETKQTKTGGSIIKMPEQPQNQSSKQIHWIMAKDKFHDRIKSYNYFIELAEDFIKSVPPSSRCLVYDRFIVQMSNEDLEKKYAYSQRHIRRKIDRLIERYVDKR
jgi:hypothetical protein